MILILPFRWVWVNRLCIMTTNCYTYLNSTDVNTSLVNMGFTGTVRNRTDRYGNTYPVIYWQHRSKKVSGRDFSKLLKSLRQINSILN